MKNEVKTTISNNEAVRRIVLETLADGNTYTRSTLEGCKKGTQP